MIPNIKRVRSNDHLGGSIQEVKNDLEETKDTPPRYTHRILTVILCPRSALTALISAPGVCAFRRSLNAVDAAGYMGCLIRRWLLAN